jgi:hypothetical protein
VIVIGTDSETVCPFGGACTYAWCLEVEVEVAMRGEQRSGLVWREEWKKHESRAEERRGEESRGEERIDEKVEERSEETSLVTFVLYHGLQHH